MVKGTVEHQILTYPGFPPLVCYASPNKLALVFHDYSIPLMEHKLYFQQNIFEPGDILSCESDHGKRIAASRIFLLVHLYLESYIFRLE